MDYKNFHDMVLLFKHNLETLSKTSDQSAEFVNKFRYLLSYDYDFLSLGSACNNNCFICDTLQRKNRINKTMDQIKEEISKITSKSKKIIIAGGEPTIRRDIFKILSYAKRLGFEKIAIETNGRMFCYPDFCKKIIEAGANQFNIYLFGPNPEVHDSITRTNGSWKQTVEGIKNLLSMNQNVQINIGVNYRNHNHLFDIYSFLKEMGINSIQFILPREVKTSKSFMLNTNRGVIPFYLKTGSELKKIFEYDEKNKIGTEILSFEV
jgi:MoaA/NifB/PqqE/SkfB family radical SAM enzyme